jgi:NADPH-dependent ferric siderophore reductase
MLTSVLSRQAQAPAQSVARPSYRPYAVSVSRVQRLSAGFTRITFTGPELAHFGTAGHDQRVKLVLPLSGSGLTHFPFADDWYATWRELADEQRNPLRTYTVQSSRPGSREIDIDFVRHGDEGTAARWLNEVGVGAEVAIVGPDARGENPRAGIEWNPGKAHTVLLAGDETAVPAICAILAGLARDVRGIAFIEIPDGCDSRETDAPAGVEVRWLARSAPGTEPLAAAVRDWTRSLLDATLDTSDLKTGGLYGWLAGEQSLVADIRRILVKEAGIDKAQVTFMGYWRTGRPEN